MSKKIELIILSILVALTGACKSTDSINSDREVASDKSVVYRITELEPAVDIHLNTEYRGTFVADVSTAQKILGIPGVLNRDCTGSISIWFYVDHKGKLRYYSKGQKGNNVNCKLPGLGDMADLSQSGMDKCAGKPYDYNNVDVNNIDYLREIDFKEKHINAPACSETKVVDEYKDTLKLAIFRPNGLNGNLHLQITMFKVLKMNYYLTPVLN